jgi:hypothetical protein
MMDGPRKFTQQERLRITHLPGGTDKFKEIVDCKYVDMGPRFIQVDVEVKEIAVSSSGMRGVRHVRKNRMLNLDFVTSIDEWYEKPKE